MVLTEESNHKAGSADHPGERLREDFCQEAHRKIFDVIACLAERDEPPDVVTVSEELRRRGQLENVGGVAYINTLTNSVPTAAHVEFYARVVLEKSTRRRLFNVGGQIKDLVCDQDADLETIRGRALALVENATRARHVCDFSDGVYASELLRTKLADPEWAVPGMFVAGLNVLVGKAKLGKSWLVYSIAAAIAYGGKALGEIPVTQGRVLYLALEDSLPRLQDRLLRILDPDEAARLTAGAGKEGGEQAELPLHLFTRWPRWSDGGRKRLEEYLRRFPETRLVIIDTFAKFMDPPGKLGNAYEQDSIRWGNVKELADSFGVTILVIHHFNKMRQAEDWVDQVSGSTGISGAADCVVGFFRKRNAPYATLKIVGRDIQDTEDRAVEWTEHAGPWTLAALTPEHLAKSEEQQAVITVLREHGQWIRPADLADILGQNPSTVRNLLRRMLGAGTLRCHNSEYGLPEWEAQEHSQFGSTGATGATSLDRVDTPTAESGVVASCADSVAPVAPVDPIAPVNPVDANHPDFNAELELPQNSPAEEEELR